MKGPGRWATLVIAALVLGSAFPFYRAVAGSFTPEAELFGDGADGGPTADDWARAAGTINYEIVTRISPRVPRRFINEENRTPKARQEKLS